MALLGRVAPPLLLMALIYYLSDQPDLSSGLGGWDLYLRKAAHMTEYAVLFVLLTRMLGWRLPLLAALLAVGYAATDEWHQTTVQGRHGTPRDVLIDAAGIAVGAVVLRAVRRRRATGGQGSPDAEHAAPGPALGATGADRADRVGS